MDKTPSAHSILDTLRTVEFRLGLKGYNVDEVDEYLEKAALEAEQVQERLRTANERLQAATGRIAQLEEELPNARAGRAGEVEPETHQVASAEKSPAPEEAAVSSDALQRTLLLAQKFVEQAKRESEAEATQVVSQAEERARALLAESEERARKLASEAEERLRDEVARLEEARGRLAGDVAEMSRHLDEQRTKIRESLTEVLRWVDERMAVPGGSAAEPGAAAGSAQRPGDRKPAGDAAGSVERTRTRSARTSAASPEGGPGDAGAGSLVGAAVGAGTGVGRAQGSTDRPQAPSAGRPAVEHRGLFEVGREATSQLGGGRLGE
ncbi:MAG: DivIVA domain-containing protein [Acidimicrobiales bacterium]